MIKYFVILAAVISNVAAQISLRSGMREIPIHKNSKIMDVLLDNLQNKFIWSGLFLYAVSFVLYLLILSKYEVSQIYPVLTALIFILLLFLSSVFLNESITTQKVVGVLVIVIGIYIASNG